MANKKIRELAAGSTPMRGNELLAADQNGVTFKFTAQSVADLAAGLVVGDVNTIASKDAIANLQVGGTQQFLLAMGYSAPGDGGGLIYKRVANQPAHAIRALSSDGVHFEGVCEGRDLNVKANGVTMDGATDDTTALQGAIDACAMYGVAGSALIPIGTTIISNTLQIGYGDSFVAGRLVGAGESPFDVNYCSVIDARAFSDRPAIAVSGARFSKIERLSLIGANYDHINTYALGFNATIDDTSVSAWWSSSLDADGASRYAPYAGIAIDPYAGSAPTPSYPGATYGKTRYCSFVDINNVVNQGFYVGVVVQPSGSDAQGEYVTFNGGRISRSVYGIGICQFNARRSKIQDIHFANTFCAITTYTFGAKHGKSATAVFNCDVNGAIQWADLYCTAIGIYSFRDCYCENTWRFGDLHGSMALILDNCTFNLDSHFLQSNTTARSSSAPYRGVPLTLVESDDPTIPFVTKGGIIQQYHSVAFIDTYSHMAEISQTWFIPRTNWARRFQYQKNAHDATMGGLIFAKGISSQSDTIRPRYAAYNGHNGLRGGYWGGSRSFPTPLWVCRHAADGSAPGFYSTKQGATVYDVADRRSKINMANVASVTVVNTVNDGIMMVLVFNSASNIDPIYGPDAGDVLIDNSNHVYFVRSKNGRTVTAQLQNDFYYDDRIFKNRTAIDTTEIICLSSRFFTPDGPIVGDFTSGSGTVANVKTGTSSVTANVQAGDYFVSPSSSSPVFGVGTAPKVNSVSSGQIVFDTNAAATKTAVPMATFSKPGPTVEDAAFDPLVCGARYWIDVQDTYQMWRGRTATPTLGANLIYQSNNLTSNPSAYGVRAWGIEDFVSTPVKNQAGPSGAANYAWLLQALGGQTNTFDIYQVFNSLSGQHTFQAKVKAVAGSPYCKLEAGGAYAIFNLNTYTVSSVTAGASAAIVADSGGYYLASITTPVSGSVAYVNFQILPSSATSSWWTGSGQQVAVCDFQLNAGATALTYFETGVTLYDTASIDSPVGAILNKGVIGGVLLAPTDAQRPYLRWDAVKSKYYLDFTVNSGNAYYELPTPVTPTAYSMEISAWNRQSAAIEQVSFGASGAEAYGSRWATDNHIKVKFSDTGYDSGADAGTGYNVLTGYRDNTNTEYLRKNEAAISSGAGSGTFSNSLNRLGIVNGSNNAAYLYGAALFLTDNNAANITALETYFTSLVGI